VSGVRVQRRDDLLELAPVLRRAVILEPGGLARLRASEHQVAVLVRLPFGVLVSRTLAVECAGNVFDVTVRASDLLAWLDGEVAGPPEPRDAEWRAGLPPASGWQRIDTVPDDVVRGLVRAGAQTLKDAAERAGLAGAQPRAEVADVLLDSVVLTVTSAGGGSAAPITLRALSALTRMGFLTRGSHAAVDVAGRWIRIAAEFGSGYSERPGLGLTLR
jgi:hypothetical protein